MGRHATPRTPRGMPSTERINKTLQSLVKPFVVVGNRGLQTLDNRDPNDEIHCNYRFVSGSPNDASNKHLIFFIHGFNITPNEALGQAKSFFEKLQASFRRDGQDTDDYQYYLFTWPGDVGTIYFNDAQRYAHHSGVALHKLLQDIENLSPKSVNIVTHSLGAHIALRALSILGNFRVNDKTNLRVDSTLLLAASVEDDVFSTPRRGEEYHFPEAAFGLKRLHISVSRSDNVLSIPFRINELDLALGHTGPQNIEELVSLRQRVKNDLEGEDFIFELHDFSPNSATILNPKLFVRDHGGYWNNQEQTDYYINLLATKA